MVVQFGGKMPASIFDPVSSALRLSLSTNESQNSSLLDNRLLSSAKSVLLSKIDFEESGDYQSNVLDGLKSKYVVIRPKKPGLETKLLKKECSGNSQITENKVAEQGLPTPKCVLFPLENVQLGWTRAWSVGAGMQNVGNTCYLNSTLQALFHVPAFANWLMSEGQHIEKCRQQEGCVICGMRATLIATQKSGGAPIKPWQVYSKLRLICKHLTPGRQEDAHEFLRYLVEAMEKCYLSRFINFEKLDQYSKETTPLNQILGGYLRSTVRCLACHHLSTTYQHFQDLLLDIRKHSTLDEALESFFSRERLEDLGYKCEACNKKVSATKQFFVERAPMVLCIALKRFSLAGGKLSKHVQFRKRINLNKYTYHKNNQQQLAYKLVSLVTHLGPSQNCGHYTAIGQAPNSNYYQFDDSCVRPLPLSSVLGTNAYIMFFEKDNGVTEETIVSTASTSSVVYNSKISENALNREKSPLKLTFYKNDERKPLAVNLNSTITESLKSEVKPIILNSTLSQSTESNSSKMEPWVMKQNGDVEKVSTNTKPINGLERTYKADQGEIKTNYIIKGSKLVIHNEPNGDSDNLLQCNQKVPEKVSIKVVKPPKSPLEKLEEQMNRNTNSESLNSTQRNVNFGSKLVPYDSESSGDEKGDKMKDDRSSKQRDVSASKVDRNAKPTKNGSPQRLIVTTKSMHQSWTVSSENSRTLLSPSLNGVTHKKVKEKEENLRSLEENGKSPNTSTSTMSPLSEQSDKSEGTKRTVQENVQTSGDLLKRHDTLRQLQHMSHRGYGAPVNTWNGNQSHMGRQIFDERRDERKRAFDGIDDIDSGRIKKVKKFHQFNRFNNNRNGYNPFQDKQNRHQWGQNFKYHDRRPQHYFHHKQYNKYKRFNRYGNSHHYPRHH